MTNLIISLVFFISLLPKQDVIPFFWGCYLADHQYRCWITSDDGFPDFGKDGFVQLLDDQGRTYILPFWPHGYGSGRNTYKTQDFLGIDLCGRTLVAIYARLGGVVAELHQPNSYKLNCNNLPLIRA